MNKVAIMMAEGYEESETTTIIDLLRRMDIQCDSFYFGDDSFVKGMHGMYIEANYPFGEVVKEYDMIVLPGGRPGGQNLRENKNVIEMVQYFNNNGKLVGALCSGTTVLEEAKVITGKKVTGYTNYNEKLPSGIFTNALVEYDQNIITSKGPATPYPFALKIGEVFGKNINTPMDRMMYKKAGGKY